MIVLGVDPGTSNPGCALLSCDQVGAWKILRLPVLRSLDELAAELVSYMRDPTLTPSIVAVESVGFSLHASNVGQGHGSGRILEAVGVARLAATFCGARLVSVAPSTWRKVATGSGRATKEQARAAAQRRVTGWPDRKVSTNRSDAVCIAMAGSLGRMRKI